MNFVDNAKGSFPKYEGRLKVILDLVHLEDMTTKDEVFQQVLGIQNLIKVLQPWWSLLGDKDQEGSNQARKDKYLMFCEIIVIYLDWIVILFDK